MKNLPNTLLAILRDFQIYFNPKSKVGKKRLLVLITAALLVLVGTKIFGGADTTEEVTVKPTEVKVLSVSELGSQANFDTIGKVEAVSEANLQAESGWTYNVGICKGR